MVSNAKRMRYVSDNEFSTDSENNENYEDFEYQFNKKNNSLTGNGKKSKWLSRNAIMARENRLKKKMYVTNLEHEVGKLKNENEKFAKVVDNQSNLISDLRKEIKYLKSALANSSDIGNLIKNIHKSTGMSVSTSLDKKTLNSYVLQKRTNLAHPWNEKQYPNLPTPEFSAGSPSSDCLDDLNLPDLEPLPLMSLTDELSDELSSNNDLLEEHNYTTNSNEGDVGVCLHVSKHRVSLEFCSTCSENATNTWMD